MFISKVNIGENNFLIGPNNSGITSFLEAINCAIGWKSTTPEEDDFYVTDQDNFDPKNANPIEVILEFREGYDEKDRFSEMVEMAFGEGFIQFDTTSVSSKDDPIRYFLLKYEFKYNKERNKYEESRIFLDQNYKPITGKGTFVRRDEHLSFFPYFYLEALRDIKREIRQRSSFWGKMYYMR